MSCRDGFACLHNRPVKAIADFVRERDGDIDEARRYKLLGVFGLGKRPGDTPDE